MHCHVLNSGESAHLPLTIAQYEGVSRLNTSQKRKFKEKMVRRGVALLIESDFYQTEAGRQHFADQIKSIRYCVQETCNFDVLYALLTCFNYDFRYDLQKNIRSRRSVRQAVSLEINNYGIVQKDERGLDKVIEDAKYRMSRYNVKPNMLIMPPQLSLYMTMAPEAKMTFPLGGPAAQLAFDEGYKGFETKDFRELGVFTSNPVTPPL